jgi:hypothetical protein
VDAATKAGLLDLLAEAVAGSGEVGDQAGRLTEGEVDEPGSHFAGVHGWNRKPAGAGTTGNLAAPRTIVSTRSWNWVARRVVHGGDCPPPPRAARRRHADRVGAVELEGPGHPTLGAMSLPGLRRFAVC